MGTKNVFFGTAGSLRSLALGAEVGGGGGEGVDPTLEDQSRT